MDLSLGLAIRWSRVQWHLAVSHTGYCRDRGHRPLSPLGWLYSIKIHYLFFIFASILCLFKEFVSPDVFAHFYVILGSAEFYNAIKQWVFRVFEALFVSQFAYCYANFYALYAGKDLIEALFVAGILFYGFPIFNNINQTISPLNYAATKV